MLNFLVQSLITTFSFAGHIDYICSAANQRFYLIKQLQHQGLSKAGSDIVFNALVLSKVLYACQSFYGYLRESDIARLQALLNKAYRYRLTNNKYLIQELYERADYRLFRQICNNSNHCLHRLLSSKPEVDMPLRDRGHCYSLPLAKTEQHKNSFIVRCLYEYV